MPSLVVYKGLKFYNVYDFDNIIKIGRENTNNIILPSKEISRSHAYIKKEQNGVYKLFDNSTNGTSVGTKVLKNENYSLFHGATFQIMDFLFTFLNEVELKQSEQEILENYETLSNTDNKNNSEKTITCIRKRDNKISFIEPEKDFSTVFQHISEISSILDPQRLIDKFLEISLNIVNADRGFLVLKDEKLGLSIKAKIGFEEADDNFTYNKDVIKRVLSEGYPVITGDHNGEDSHNKGKDYNPTPIVCLPLMLYDEVIGCLYLEDNKNRKKVNFNNDDIETIKILSCQIPIALENAHLHQKAKQEKTELKNTLSVKNRTVIESEKMLEIYDYVKSIAKYNVPVLLLGEPGTGKELIATALHDFSNREGKFIAINCSAIPREMFESELFGFKKSAFTDARSDKPGRLEMADHGTIFLDEIGDLDISLQPKLLRFLQNKEITRLGDTKTQHVDVRVIAATNRDIKGMIKRQNFREDLYDRLACFKLLIPPLRERKEDIPALIKYFLKKHSKEQDIEPVNISEESVKMLKEYNWPGNVRELENVILRAMVRSHGKTITPNVLIEACEDIHEVENHIIDFFPTLEDVEKKHIEEALEFTFGNMMKTADLLGISRDTLYKKVKKYNINIIKQ